MLSYLFCADNEGYRKTKHLSEHFGMGKPKVTAFLQYMKISDLINDDNSVTHFGNCILKFKDNIQLYQSLLYYKICRGWEYGGHFYFSRSVNNVFFDYFKEGKRLFTNDDAKSKILDFQEEMPKVNEKDFKAHTIRVLNAIANEHTGFGKLGLVRRNKNEYEIGSFKPHYLVCAYILYDRWEKNSSTMEIEEVLNGDYNLRRLFFLTENDMNGIFSKLNQEGFIKLEVKAGLNQVVKDPNRTSEDILKEIYDGFCTY